jgi:hypothetical protein
VLSDRYREMVKMCVDEPGVIVVCASPALWVHVLERRQ